MEITEQLKIFKKNFDKVLKKEIDIIASDKVFENEPLLKEMIEYFRDILLSAGKRVRPFMMFYGYKAFGGNAEQKILKACVSIELIHSFLLMHDDIIDRDDFRHNKKTIHAIYRDYSKFKLNNTDAIHFGNSVAIIFGDMIYSMANNLLFTSKFDARLIIKATVHLQDIVKNTALGEMQDIILDFKDKIKEEDVFEMYKNKTARYTFEGPFKLGAVLSGTNPKNLNKISEFTLPLGIAFQLQDDMLGILGNEKVLGKPVGSDIVEGKKTLLVVRALKLASNKQRKEINELLGNKNISSKEISDFLAILRELNIIDNVNKEINQYFNQAVDALNELDIDKSVKNTLVDMVLYLRDRKF